MAEIIDYQSGETRRRKRLPLVFWSLLILVALAVAIYVELSSVVYRRGGNYSRGFSAAHLKEIGEMCALYANDYQDHLPDNVGILATTEDLSLTSLLSPYGQGLTPPPTTLPAVIIPWANQHSDYEYLGAGQLLSKMGPNTILGHEKWPIAQVAGGMNILYGDGHVEWHTLADAKKILKGAKGRAPALSGAG